MRYKAPRHLLLLHSRFLLVNMAFEGRRIRVRLSLGVEFDSQAAKSAFSSRLEYISSLLTHLDYEALTITVFCRPCSTSWRGQCLLLSRVLRGLLPVISRAVPALQQILPALVLPPLTDQLLCNLSTPMQVSANLHTCKYHSGMIRI